MLAALVCSARTSTTVAVACAADRVAARWVAMPVGAVVAVDAGVRVDLVAVLVAVGWRLVAVAVAFAVAVAIVAVDVGCSGTEVADWGVASG